MLRLRRGARARCQSCPSRALLCVGLFCLCVGLFCLCIGLFCLCIGLFYLCKGLFCLCKGLFWLCTGLICLWPGTDHVPQPTLDHVPQPTLPRLLDDRLFHPRITYVTSSYAYVTSHRRPFVRSALFPILSLHRPDKTDLHYHYLLFTTYSLLLTLHYLLFPIYSLVLTLHYLLFKSSLCTDLIKQTYMITKSLFTTYSLLPTLSYSLHWPDKTDLHYHKISNKQETMCLCAGAKFCLYGAKDRRLLNFCIENSNFLPCK